jgi:hypothetical protein
MIQLTLKDSLEDLADKQNFHLFTPTRLIFQLTRFAPS